MLSINGGDIELFVRILGLRQVHVGPLLTLCSLCWDTTRLNFVFDPFDYFFTLHQIGPNPILNSDSMQAQKTLSILPEIAQTEQNKPHRYNKSMQSGLNLMHP
jgi:hypothetical protein